MNAHPISRRRRGSSASPISLRRARACSILRPVTAATRVGRATRARTWSRSIAIAEALASLAGVPRSATRAGDLESGAWALAGERFDAIVVANYLHRPLFPHLRAALAPDGVLLYETFAMGNEAFGRPSNPDFLLCRDEL